MEAVDEHNPILGQVRNIDDVGVVEEPHASGGGQAIIQAPVVRRSEAVGKRSEEARAGEQQQKNESEESRGGVA